MDGATLSVDEGAFVGLWLETFLYGIAATLFWSTLTVLLKGRASIPINKPILSATLLMFAIATTHIVLNFVHTFYGLFSLPDVPGNAIVYFGQLDNPQSVAKDALVLVQIIVGDAANLYRLWLVWNRHFRPMIIPGILFLVSATSACLSVVLLSNTSSVMGLDEDFPLSNSVLVFQIIAVIQPVLTSGLIVFCLWKSEKNVSAYRVGTVSSTLPVVKMVTESAAIYVAALLVLVILYGLSNPGFLVVSEMMSPIVPITFFGLTTRVGVHSFKVQLVAAQEASPFRSEEGSARAPRTSVITKSAFGMSMRDGVAEGDEYSMEEVGAKPTEEVGDLAVGS